MCLSVCLSTGVVPVMIKPLASWRFGRLTGMAMQILGVAIRWQIAENDHAKSWHVAVIMVMAWRLAGTQAKLAIFLILMVICCQKARYTHESPYLPRSDFAALFVRPSEGPTRSPLSCHSASKIRHILSTNFLVSVTGDKVQKACFFHDFAFFSVCSCHLSG